MELGELRLEVGEAAHERLAMLAPDEHEHLLAEQANVLREGVDLLERAVVQVESQPNEQPLVRRGQPRLVLFRAGSLRLAHCLPGLRATGGYADSTVRAPTTPVR